MNTRSILLFLLIIFSYFVQIETITELNLEQIRADILSNHNYHRKRHQVGDLERDSEIEGIAQSYSEYLAQIDEMKHSGNGYGENLFYCYSSNRICITGEYASQEWYNEVEFYDFDNPGFSSETGHFTQLVWKSSKKIGCGAACNSKNKCYVSCNYYPPGNYINQFEENVFDKLPEPETDDQTDSKTDDQTDSKTDDQTDNKTDDQTDVKTDDQTDVKTDDQTDTKTDDLTDIKTDDQTDEKPDDQTDGKTDDQTDSKTDDQTDGKTDDQTDSKTDDQTDDRTDDSSDHSSDTSSDDGKDNSSETLFTSRKLLISIFFILLFF